MSNEVPEPDDGDDGPEETANEQGGSTGDEVTGGHSSTGSNDGPLDIVADETTIGELRRAAAEAERDEGDQITTDELFDLLASPGSRFVLTYLIRSDGPAAYSELVEYVVDRTETPSDQTKSKFRGQVAARLVHSTLPKLADAGLVTYDEDDQVVSPTPAIHVVTPYLALAVSRSRQRDAAESTDPD